MSEGLLGRKLGMTQIWDEDGTVVPVTVVEAGPCVVTQIKTVETDGYNAIQVGWGQKKRLNKPLQGHLKGLGNFRYLREFRVENPAAYELGQQLTVELFQPGDLVDVTGTSKGRGFAGVVKRHGFAGGPKTHGQSDRHRAPGSIGSTTTPGRVFKGLRMAGHMGNQQVTVRNLRVARIDPERGILMLRGAVPGARNGLLRIRRTRVPAKKTR